MKSLRIVFFGTPEIAVPTLEGLIAGPHEVVGVVSQPDRPRGRGRKLSPSPVAAVALGQNLPLLRPEKVGDDETVEALRALEPDLGVVVAFGQFIPKKIRELPSCGYLINAHASLLPKYRGAAPIARVILDGERETGISVMRIEREMDAGPVALVARTPIEPRENTAELSLRLAELAARAIADGVDQIARDDVAWTDQDASQATFAEKILKADAQLDLRESAPALANRIHALSPKPGGSLYLTTEAAVGSDDGTEPSDQDLMLKISRADTLAFEPGESPAPGTLAYPEPASHLGEASHSGEASDSAAQPLLRVATGDGWLVPLVLQRAGGKALPLADFLRGFEIPSGARARLLRQETA